jgi:hypothetical protein
MVEIADVRGPGDLGNEVLVVVNQGGRGDLDLWRVSDSDGNTFTFPAVVLYPNAQVRVHSREGANTPADLYWQRTAPAWDVGELLTLRDANGEVVDTYIVP